MSIVYGVMVPFVMYFILTDFVVSAALGIPVSSMVYAFDSSTAIERLAEILSPLFTPTLILPAFTFVKPDTVPKPAVVLTILLPLDEMITNGETVESGIALIYLTKA